MIFFFGHFFSPSSLVLWKMWENFIKKLKNYIYSIRKNTIWKEFLVNINETYPCMKRKPIYPPTNNITKNVHQKSSKIDFIVFRISLHDKLPSKNQLLLQTKEMQLILQPINNISLNVVQTYSRIRSTVFKNLFLTDRFFSRGNYLVCGFIKWLWLQNNFEWLPWQRIKGSA